MVTIIDITEKIKRKSERAKLEARLAEECFKDNEVSICSIYLIAVSDGSRTRASKSVGDSQITVYDEGVLPQTETFAKKYEEQFDVSDFIIETDYSGRE